MPWPTNGSMELSAFSMSSRILRQPSHTTSRMLVVCWTAFKWLAGLPRGSPWYDERYHAGPSTSLQKMSRVCSEPASHRCAGWKISQTLSKRRLDRLFEAHPRLRDHRSYPQTALALGG